MKRIFLGMFCLILLSVISLPAPSRASSFFQDYGAIRPSAEAWRLFSTYTIVPNYRYYISGSNDFPDAIIGVDQTYALEGDLWKEVEMTSAKLKELVEDMQLMAREHVLIKILHGFDILDNKGKRIGIWYSILSAVTNVKMEGDHRVLIYTPPLDVWHRR